MLYNLVLVSTVQQREDPSFFFFFFVKIPHFFKHLEHRYSIPYQFYYYGLWSYMSIKYYFCIYSLVKGWLLGACSSLIVSYSGFFLVFFFFHATWL